MVAAQERDERGFAVLALAHRKFRAHDGLEALFLGFLIELMRANRLPWSERPTPACRRPSRRHEFRHRITLSASEYSVCRRRCTKRGVMRAPGDGGRVRSSCGARRQAPCAPTHPGAGAWDNLVHVETI